MQLHRDLEQRRLDHLVVLAYPLQVTSMLIHHFVASPIIPVLLQAIPQISLHLLHSLKPRTYIGVEGCQVNYWVPGFSIIRDQRGTYNVHLEVDNAQIHGLFNFVGRFVFYFKCNSKLITSQWVDINSLTGNMESGFMKSNVDQRSVIINDPIVTYSLNYAGQDELACLNLISATLLCLQID
jgi:hypothetical protein